MRPGLVAYRDKVIDTVLGPVALTRAWYHCAIGGHGFARAYPLAGVKKDELDTALGYFENNAPRMRYKWFRSRSLFVGSGAVEAGCKSVIGQRLKLSGMHRTVDGADAIATLRCQQASRSEERIWPTPHNQTPAA